jgi:molybdenum cofactor biosynthesis enzyme
MTKSIDPGMTIDQIRLDEKTGGTRGDWRRGEGRIRPQP